MCDACSGLPAPPLWSAGGCTCCWCHCAPATGSRGEDSAAWGCSGFRLCTTRSQTADRPSDTNRSFRAGRRTCTDALWGGRQRHEGVNVDTEVSRRPNEVSGHLREFLFRVLIKGSSNYLFATKAFRGTFINNNNNLTEFTSFKFLLLIILQWEVAICDTISVAV